MSRRQDTPAAVMASVNLLSPWVHEHLRARRLRVRFTVALLALVLLLGGAWVFQRLELTRAEADLRGEEATAASLRERITDLAPVQQYVDGVDRRVRTVQELMVTDVAFSQVLAALAEATPAGASIDSLSLELPPATTTAGLVDAAGNVTTTDPARGLQQASCPGPDPFATLVVVGCLTLSGTAIDRGTVGELVNRLARSRVFVEPFVSTTTTDEGADGNAAGSLVTFTGSVALHQRVFSGRYDDLRAEIGLAERGPR